LSGSFENYHDAILVNGKLQRQMETDQKVYLVIESGHIEERFPPKSNLIGASFIALSCLLLTQKKCVLRVNARWTNLYSVLRPLKLQSKKVVRGDYTN
jgi:hypothetical protein